MIQTLLGHAKLDTTALYTRVANATIRTVPSPLDRALDAQQHALGIDIADLERDNL